MTTPTTTAPQPGEPSRPSGGGRRLLLGLGVTIAVLAVVGGALNIVGSLARQTERHTATYQGVRTVDVDVYATSVDVVAAAGTATRVDRSISWSLTKPTVEERLDGDRLVIRTHCRAFFGRGCGGHVRLTVPAATEVRAHSSAGSVAVQGTRGSVDASSSAGTVRVSDVTGTLVLHSSAGSVEASRLRSARVDAGSSAGSVQLQFDAAPVDVSARSSAGGVDITVPAGAEAYRVDATSSAGSTDIGVPTDPQADRRIQAHSSAGSVHVRAGG